MDWVFLPLTRALLKRELRDVSAAVWPIANACYIIANFDTVCFNSSEESVCKRDISEGEHCNGVVAVDRWYQDVDQRGPFGPSRSVWYGRFVANWLCLNQHG
jgi:hypothetical protein